MNAPIKIPSGWSRGRFLMGAGVLFTIQIGLVLLFAERPHAIASVPVQSSVRMLATPLDSDRLSKYFFAADPTLFSSASFHGFSGRAWLRPDVQQYEQPGRSDSSYWLALNATRLGTNFGAPISINLAEEVGMESEPVPVFLPPENPVTQSVLRLEGSLAARLISPVPELSAYASSELLSNSVVQLAVDRAGAVIAARLWERSGFPVADSNALAIARSMRFAPGGGPVTWSQAVFEWKTIAPPETPAAIPH